MQQRHVQRLPRRSKESIQAGAELTQKTTVQICKSISCTDLSRESTGHSQVPVPPLVKLPEPVMKVDIGVSTEVAKVDVGVSTYRRTFTNVIGSRPSAPAAASASLSALASAFGSASASGSEPAPELSLVKECRKLPKVIRGRNELGDASDASQLVAWRLLIIPEDKLINCLDNLADEQHIKTRIPKICDIFWHR